MSKDEVIARRRELDAKMREARRAIEHIRVDIQHLYLECNHPDAYERSIMGGETVRECPDCKHQS